MSRYIARGGMGAVAHGFDQQLKRDVAIKFVLDDLAHDPRFHRRLEREALLYAQMGHHPQVVEVIDLVWENRRPFLILELLKGATLEALVPASGRFSWCDVRDRLIEAANALLAVHKAGIIHRDFKPSNLFVEQNHNVLKLIDFGIAKLTTESEQVLNESLTEVGQFLGTAAYSAPELVLRHPASIQSDMYAFAVTAVKLLTGAPLYYGDTSQVLRAHVKEPIPDLAGRVDGVPREAWAVLTKCLEKEPGNRFASTQDLVSALRSTPSQKSVRVLDDLRHYPNGDGVRRFTMVH